MEEIKRCTRCIMDNSSDTTITFDENGYCNYCSDALALSRTTYFPSDIGKEKIQDIINTIKRENKDKKYDCIIGISGGLDSSYLAYLAHTWGLRILGVHVDDGYDTEISKSNIEKLCKAANIEMRMIKPDPMQFNALTLAYMRAGVPNLAIPQDNILLASLYDFVKKEKMKYFFSGGNFALECILQHGNTHNALDLVNIKDIHRRFGTEPINKLKFTSSYTKYLNMKLGRVVTVTPLNYVDYNRDRAFSELKEFCGFEYYGRKHLENILTAFIQLYWLPLKFNVDKRTSHLSSMIISGQLTRDDALKELDEPLYDETQMNEYIEIIKRQIGISDMEFEKFMKSAPHQHTDYRFDKLDGLIRPLLS